MLQVKEIVNSIFTSKTYILYREGDDKAWLVDIGDIVPVTDFLAHRGLKACGVFITHAHFDHIYGINSLLKYFPECKVYVNPYAKEALASEKLNMSKYHEWPITYAGENVVVLHEKDEMILFDNEPAMQFYETPGHNPGCLTMVIGDMIFTGDAYIPGVGVNTIPPHSNKEHAKLSYERIMQLAEGKRLFPGHIVKD